MKETDACIYNVDDHISLLFMMIYNKLSVKKSLLTIFGLVHIEDTNTNLGKVGLVFVVGLMLPVGDIDSHQLLILYAAKTHTLLSKNVGKTLQTECGHHTEQGTD